MISFSPPNKSAICTPRCGHKGGSERSRDLPQVAQLLSGELDFESMRFDCRGLLSLGGPMEVTRGGGRCEGPCGTDLPPGWEALGRGGQALGSANES